MPAGTERRCQAVGMSAPVVDPHTPMMLARREATIPEGDGWLYEPKWDGFRAIAARTGDTVELVSRDGRALARYFPELVALLAGRLPEGAVVDGEIVVVGDGGLDFDALLQRIHPASSRIGLLAEATPASFVAFDLLAVGERSLLDEPLTERRRALGEVAGAPAPSITALTDPRAEVRAPTGPELGLTPQTADPAVATGWLFGLDDRGLDGVVAKRAEGTYLPGQRVMVKVKRKRTADCVVGGYRLGKGGDGVGSLLLGLYDDSGVLHYVGHTSSFKAAERRALLERLRPLEGGSSFGRGRTPGGPSRWARGRDTSWVPVRPDLVCEVSFDRMMSGRFRHAATFERWRPDRDPRDCRFDQLAAGRG